MKQTKTIKKEVESEIIVDVVCNLCGESCSLGPSDGSREPSKTNDTSSYGGLIEQTVGGGYNSTPGNGEGALDDTCQYTFSLCEFCLDFIFTNCKIPPKVFCYIDAKIDPWRSAKQRVMEDDWRQQKEGFLEEAARRDSKRQ